MTDPDDEGHPLVAVGYERDAFLGFPVMTATVTYAGRGPRAVMGWVQVIERRDDNAKSRRKLTCFRSWAARRFTHLRLLVDAGRRPCQPTSS